MGLNISTTRTLDQYKRYRLSDLKVGHLYENEFGAKLVPIQIERKTLIMYNPTTNAFKEIIYIPSVLDGNYYTNFPLVHIGPVTITITPD